VKTKGSIESYFGSTAVATATASGGFAVLELPSQQQSQQQQYYSDGEGGTQLDTQLEESCSMDRRVTPDSTAAETTADATAAATAADGGDVSSTAATAAAGEASGDADAATAATTAATEAAAAESSENDEAAAVSRELKARTAKFRAMMEAHRLAAKRAKRARKDGIRGLCDFDFGTGSGPTASAKCHHDDNADDVLRPEDLEGIVDTFSDGEGDSNAQNDYLKNEAVLKDKAALKEMLRQVRAGV
jgi:hypothetical protein